MKRNPFIGVTLQSPTPGGPGYFTLLRFTTLAQGHSVACPEFLIELHLQLERVAAAVGIVEPLCLVDLMQVHTEHHLNYHNNN